MKKFTGPNGEPMTTMNLGEEIPAERQAEIDARKAAYQATHGIDATPDGVALGNDHIDLSDIPSLADDEEFWEKATAGWPPPQRKIQLSLRLDNEVVDYFKERGRGYQSRINAVLRAYVEAQRRAEKAK